RRVTAHPQCHPRRMPRPARSRLRYSSKLGWYRKPPTRPNWTFCAERLSGNLCNWTLLSSHRLALLCAISAAHDDTALHASHLHRPCVSTYRRGGSAPIWPSALPFRVSPFSLLLLLSAPLALLLAPPAR